MPCILSSADLQPVSGTGFAILGLAALLVGFVKTGLPPLGILIPVVMALAFPTRESVGALLPFLIVGDTMAVCFYRRAANWRALAQLLPPVVVGMVFGYLVLDRLDDRLLRQIIGGLVLGLIVLDLVRERVAREIDLQRVGIRAGVGASAGFATVLANAAGPIMSLYLIAAGLDKARFMGTAAVFFLAVNVSKVPVFLELGMLQRSYLEAFALLFPLVIAGGFVGRRFLAWIPQQAFRRAVLTLTALSSAVLLLS